MTIAEYMELTKITEEQLAKKLGRNQSVINRYKSGQITPSLEVIAKLDKITKGAVSFKDFVRAA